MPPFSILRGVQLMTIMRGVQVMTFAPGRARLGAAFGKTDRSASVEAAGQMFDHQIISPGWSKIGEDVSTKAFSTKELRGYEMGCENEKLSLARVPPYDSPTPKP